MNITFFIGNGFDINLGLKTRYSDFYPYFIEHSSEDNIIKEWLTSDNLLWADLEEKLGENISRLHENQKEKYYDDKAELDGLLLDYLEEEQKKFVIEDSDDSIIEEFKKSMLQFKDVLSEDEKASIDQTYRTYCNEQYTYSFITFNYTNSLDRIIEYVSRQKNIIGTHSNSSGQTKNDTLGKLLHVHGTVNEEMILGVNDVSQIHNEVLKKDEEFLDTFIKVRMNKSIGQRKTDHAKTIIGNSHIICVFGMSLGNTDKFWWEELVSWLLNNTNNKLIIFYKGYKEELKKRIPIKIIRLNNKLKNSFVSKGKGKYSDEQMDQIKNRIFIAYDADIFNFLN